MIVLWIRFYLLAALLAFAFANIAYAQLHRDRTLDTYWMANGEEYHSVDRATYEKAVRDKSCQPSSHVSMWADTHETQHICEL